MVGKEQLVRFLRKRQCYGDSRDKYKNVILYHFEVVSKVF